MHFIYIKAVGYILSNNYSECACPSLFKSPKHDLGLMDFCVSTTKFSHKIKSWKINSEAPFSPPLKSKISCQSLSSSLRGSMVFLLC